MEVEVTVEVVQEIAVNVEVGQGISLPFFIDDPHLTQWVDFWIETGE